MKQRRAKILQYSNDLGCDSAATMEPKNLFYMTGFWGEAAGLLEEDDRITIIAPELEADRARSESTDCDVVVAERGTGLVSSLVARIGARRVCVDCQTYGTMISIMRSIPSAIPSAIPFTKARSIKDNTEVSILRKASRIIDDMFELCVQKIRLGMKESELQAELISHAASHQMFDTGYPFTLNPLIVAGGPNGALPHAQVTNRRFASGEMIVVDITLRYQGYVSDATRTFALGPVTDEARRIYDTVREAQRLGLKAVRRDTPCKAVDYVCRRAIEDAGYGEYFVHSTGHGVGLDVHEEPVISARSTEQLSAGMALTVEPGVYIPGRLGVRIEDSVIVRERPEIMHKFAKDLITL